MHSSRDDGVASSNHKNSSTGLSLFFTILCIVDLFGVFPVVALPKSIIACGFYGIPLVLAVFGLQIYTALLLGKSWLLAQTISPRIKEKNRYPYAAVAELAFGNGARNVVTCLIDATIFAAGVPNLIVASQSLQLFWWKMTEGEVAVSYCVWMLVIALLLCPIMWIGSPKDMKWVAVTSVLIVSTVAVCTWICIVQDAAPDAVFESREPTFRDFLTAYGIIAFQFDIHPMLLTIQVDMREGRHVGAAVVAGFVITGAMFAVTSALAAYRYGDSVENNILRGITPSITLFTVALLVTLQLCLSSAVGNSPLFQHLEDMLAIPREFCLRRCLLRSSVVALAVFLGESVPRFDLVMGLVGSTLTGPLMFILPPLLFVKLCYARSKLNITKNSARIRQDGGALDDFQNGADASQTPLIIEDAFSNKYNTFDSACRYACDDGIKVEWYEVTLASTVMGFGVIMTAIATYTSWIDAASSAAYAPPCLINASAAARRFIETKQL